MNPNVISYFNTEKDAVEHLAWSCRLFKILVPTKKESSVDIFEKTLLQLIHEHVDDVDSLHSMTGLPKDFVKLIVQKLQSSELLTKNLKLTDIGKEAVTSIEVIQSQKEWRPIGILVENTTGEILDIIVNDNVNNFVTVDGIYGDYARIILGTSGKSKKFSLKIINGCLSSKNKELNIIEIKTLFKSFQKRLLGYRSSSSADDFPLNTLSLHTNFDEVELIGEPIDVYLHCAVYFNEGNNFIYVEDGIGYSQKLTNILPKEIKDGVRKKLVIKNIDSKNIKIYKNDIIIDNVKKIEELFIKIKNYSDNNVSGNKIKEYQSNQNELIKLFYDTIEHCIAYINETRVFNEWKSYIKDRYEDNHRQIKYIFINNFGIKETQDMESILSQLSKVTYGQVNSLSFGNVSLMPLLVKSIYASQLLEGHPLSALLKCQPDFFSNLHKLHQLRNKVSHGNKVKPLPQESIEWIYQMGMEAIHMLYPKSTLLDKSMSEYSDRELSQKYLKAEIRLNTYFQGVIPELVRYNLSRLFELDYIEKDIAGKTNEVITEVDKLKYIMHLSSSIEKSLLFQIENLVSLSNEIPNYQKKEFLEWLNENKITISATLEKKLNKINALKIKQMYEYSRNLALLDLFILYLFLSMSLNDLSLKIMINQGIDISDTIVKVHKFRGHSNGMTDEFRETTDEQIIKLQKDAFLIIQILTQSC